MWDERGAGVAVFGSMKPATQGWGNTPTRIEAAGAPDALADLAALSGQKLGNYIIERPLARGGMAVVYLAKHPALGREVAVKLLSPEYQADVDLNRRFLQEARVTAGFRHPNIVEIYDLGEIDGRAYFTMERLLGLDLASQLAKKGRFSARDVSAYFQQICAALAMAHDVGVVHRDLKPGNIFVVSEDPLHVKLMDFGIAKITETRQIGATQRGEVLGTPAYMAPEQAIGNVDAITPSTDIYALGVIAYEMLTGQLPFSAESDLLLLTMHIRDTPRPLRELAPATPPAFAALIERCLEKERSDRPANVAELARELARASLDAAPATAAAEPSPEEPPPRAPARSVARRVQTDGLGPVVVARGVRAAAGEPIVVALASDQAEDGAEPAEELADAVEPAVAETPSDVDDASPGAIDDIESSPRVVARFAPVETRRHQMIPLLSELTDEPMPTGSPVTLSGDDGKVLDKLLRRMQRRADFPSFLNNVTEISRKADADADFSAMQLSESILKDFALTAKLLRMVNGLYANRFGGKVFSVSQAVVILGFDSVRSMALGVSVYKLSSQKGPPKTGRHHEDLADESINSLISGELARILAPKAGIKETELAMMCAMFKNLGQHLTMEYLPDEHDKILKIAEAERISRAAASQRVLGLSLSKLGLGVAERWCLPQLMRAAMASNPRPDVPLIRDEDKLGALARLSNDFCHIIANGERQNYRASLQRLLATHKRLLTLNDQDINSLLGTVCKSFETRYSALFGPYHRKSRFLFNARGLTGQAALPERKVTPPLTPEDIEKLEHRAQVLADRLQVQVQRRQPADALLGEAMETLARVLDVARVTLLTQTTDRKELEVRLSVGEDAKNVKAHFRIPVGHGADFFSTAVRSGKNVIVADALGPGSMRRVPQKYFEVLGSASFGLYVCASRGYPTCLLLVDAEAPEALPTREREQASKGLRELIAKIAERK